MMPLSWNITAAQQLPADMSRPAHPSHGRSFEAFCHGDTSGAMGGQQAGLTGSVSPTVTCSEKRTFAGLDLSFAFLAALMKADLGDWKESAG